MYILKRDNIWPPLPAQLCYLERIDCANFIVTSKKKMNPLHTPER